MSICFARCQVLRMQALTPCSVDEETAANGAHSYMLVEMGGVDIPLKMQST
jgi:hypothetical protein